MSHTTTHIGRKRKRNDNNNHTSHNTHNTSFKPPPNKKQRICNQPSSTSNLWVTIRSQKSNTKVKKVITDYLKANFKIKPSLQQKRALVQDYFQLESIENDNLDNICDGISVSISGFITYGDTQETGRIIYFLNASGNDNDNIYETDELLWGIINIEFNKCHNLSINKTMHGKIMKLLRIKLLNQLNDRLSMGGRNEWGKIKPNIMRNISHNGFYTPLIVPIIKHRTTDKTIQWSNKKSKKKKNMSIF
eukprot:400389_1